MNRNMIKGTAILLALFLFVSMSLSQTGNSGVYWHVDPTVKSCSMVVDPSLTQAQWHTFVKQAGAMTTFKSLSSAQTLGTLNFLVAVDYASSPVDQHNGAWINTFTHPDEQCPLGDAVVMPALRVRMGVTDYIDVGGFWTSAPDANYGLVGGEVKYALLKESETQPAVAVRGSATILTGVPDFDMNIYSAEVLASKQFGLFTPYAGARMNVVVGTVTTSKVHLDNEVLPVMQGSAGIVCNIWLVSLAAEYNVSSVNTLALAVGLNF
jgi:hypothetical protein